ncbi:hypothetical protein AGRO_4842 [Agrobacterium sp. ATCC 31749]|nr:hypothetical protein AGRO_4842 [Agrobacterium sp. ATCC 31749]
MEFEDVIMSPADYPMPYVYGALRYVKSITLRSSTHARGNFICLI